MAKLEIEIQGMTCEGCARHVEHALEQAGAGHPDVDWRRGGAVVRQGEVDERALGEALRLAAPAFTRGVAKLSRCAA